MLLNRLNKLPIIELTIAFLIVMVPLANSQDLMFGVQTAKTFYFLYGMAVLVVLFALSFWFKKEAIRFQLSIIDILFVCYVAWLSLNKFLIQDFASFSLKYFELLGLAVLYFVIRLAGSKSALLILVAICVSGTVQAIYGNLQLWGRYPSHHGIFRMTGSFFNPGPYAGFLCAILPVALGLYWMHENFRFQISNFRFQVSDFRFQISNFRFQVANHSEPDAKTKHRKVPRIGIDAAKSVISNLKSLIFNLKPEISNLKSVISNLQSLIIKYLSLITLVAILLVLPAARSRAAWLGAIAGVAYLAWHKYSVGIRLIAFLKGRTKSPLGDLGVVLIPLLFILVTSLSLYHFKKDSADGRMLIWTVTTNIIKDNPLLGVGQDMFKAHYMDYQAAYFSKHPNSKYEMLAGDNQYAFNEALLTWAENGLIGFLLAGGIVFAVFFAKMDFKFRKWISNLKFQVSNYSEPEILNLNRSEAKIGVAKSESERSGDEASQSSENRNRRSQTSNLKPEILNLKPEILNLKPETILKSSILSALVFGMFAYPSEILPIKMVATLNIALLAGMAMPLLEGEEKPFVSFVKKPSYPLWFKSSFLIATVFALVMLQPQVKKLHQAQATWKDAMELYNYNLYEQCLASYEKAYPVLKNNGEFLINYGKALSMAEKHSQAVEILKQAQAYQTNTVLFTALGDSHFALEEYESAEQSYLQAASMAPGKFYPLYLLAKLYYASGQEHKAHEMANNLLSKEVKVHSTAIEEIRKEMSMIIENQKKGNKP
jgi:O-antigen polymerase